MDQPATGSALLGSLQALGSTLLELIGTRAELAVVELREEGERRKAMLALAVTGSLFLALGLLLVALFVVVFFWDTYRLAAIGGVTLLYLGIAGFAFARLGERLRNSPPAFETTLRVLAADRRMLQGRGE